MKPNKELQDETGKDTRRRCKREQITSAATSLFLQDSYADVSMDKIVERSRVSKRTLYNYFENKQEVFASVVQSQIELIWDDIELEDFGSDPVHDHLSHVGFRILKQANKKVPLALFRIVFAEARRFPKLAQRFYRASFQRLIDDISRLILSEMGTTEGETENIHKISERFLSLLLGVPYLRVVLGIDPPMSRKTQFLRAREAVDQISREFG